MASMRWWGWVCAKVFSAPHGWAAQPSWRAAARRLKVRPSGRSLRSPPADGVPGAEAREAVEEHAALLVPLVLPQREVAAQDAEAGAPEADDRGGEAAAVLAGGEREQDVLGALDRGAQGAEEGGARRRGAAGEDDLAGGGREPCQFLAPAEETGASWIRTRSGSQARMMRASAAVSSRMERML